MQYKFLSEKWQIGKTSIKHLQTPKQVFNKCFFRSVFLTLLNILDTKWDLKI